MMTKREQIAFNYGTLTGAITVLIFVCVILLMVL